MAGPEQGSSPFGPQEQTSAHQAPGSYRGRRTHAVGKYPRLALEQQSDYIQQRYFGEERPAKSLGEEFGVTGSVIVDFLRGKGHVTRGPAEAIRVFWADPGRKTEHNRQTHYPQANKNRADAVHNFHITHPDRSAEIVENARMRGREKTMEHMRYVLGSDPKQVLIDMHFRQGRSVEDIAAIAQVRLGTMKKWMRTLEVEERKEAKPKEVKIDETKKELVRQAIEDGTFKEKLTPLRQFILSARYIESQPKTQQELADLMQDRERPERRNISEIERKALKKLRAIHEK